MKVYHDLKYKFYELFDEKTGFFMRSNCFDTGVDPTRRSFPELIDIGIMGSCHAASSKLCANSGIDCYQKGGYIEKPDMQLADYIEIINQSKGKTFQVALGGRGDPNKHKDFETILKVTKDNGIIPNITTSGYMLSNVEAQLIAKYTGAVAVSYYEPIKNKIGPLFIADSHTARTIKKLLDCGSKVNIHYTISKETIDDAILRLSHNLFPKGINSVIFLLYKPIGLGKINKFIRLGDDKITTFLNMVTKRKYDFEIGFDTCFSPALIHCNNIANESINFCEAGSFSMYIDSELNVFPCSFAIDTAIIGCLNMKSNTLVEIWNSQYFELFRTKQKTISKKCNSRSCSGCCVVTDNMQLCNTSIKTS